MVHCSAIIYILPGNATYKYVFIGTKMREFNSHTKIPRDLAMSKLIKTSS